MARQTGSKSYRLEWYGDQVTESLNEAIGVGLANWAELHESAAKSQLAPGRGVWSGRMQKSIHAAEAGYNFYGDFRPLPATPDLSNISYKPRESGSMLAVAVGTGLIYAGIQEGRLQFVQRSHDQVIGRLPDELEQAAKAAGHG